MSLVLEVSRVLNDDIIQEILKYLEIKELFRTQRTSKQFWYCVDRQLSSEKCLIFGKNAESFLCGHPDCNCQKSSVNVSNEFIKTIVTKCPNIRCLHLNQDFGFFCPKLGLETIRSIAQICRRLECLSFGNVFLSCLLEHLPTIGLVFKDRVKHLSIECYFQEETIDWRIIEMLTLFSSLESLKIVHFKPLKNLLNYVSNNLKSLEISCSPFWFSDSLGDGDITSLVSYIESNQRCLQRLIINDYHISGQLLGHICGLLDLKELSISCRNLSLSSLTHTLAQKQRNLSILTLNGLSVENTFVDFKRHHLSVTSLGLNYCHFEVKTFISFVKMFGFLQKLSINGIYFRCECDSENETIDEYDGYCLECGRKCVQQISSSKTLKTVIFKDSRLLSQYWYPFLKIEKLERLKVLTDILGFDKHFTHEFAKGLLDSMAKRGNKRLFTLEVASIEVKNHFIENLRLICEEIPKNLRIIY